LSSAVALTRVSLMSSLVIPFYRKLVFSKSLTSLSLS